MHSVRKATKSELYGMSRSLWTSYTLNATTLMQEEILSFQNVQTAECRPDCSPSTKTPTIAHCVQMSALQVNALLTSRLSCESNKNKIFQHLIFREGISTKISKSYPKKSAYTWKSVSNNDTNILTELATKYQLYYQVWQEYVSRAIVPQHPNFIKPNCVNLPPCVAIVKYNTVVHQTTIAILLVQCLQHFHSCCQFFFLQFLILKPNNPDILCPEYRLSNNIYSNLINFLCT